MKSMIPVFSLLCGGGMVWTAVFFKDHMRMTKRHAWMALGIVIAWILFLYGFNKLLPQEVLPPPGP